MKKGKLSSASLILTLYFPIFILIFGGGYYTYRGEYERETSRLKHQAETQVALVSAAISGTLQGIGKDLITLSQLTSLKQALDNDSPDAISRLTTDFSSFAHTHKVYGQIRWLSNSGTEKVRVNYRGSQLEVISAEELQNKAHRYYFRNTIDLPAGAIYVSPMDLNIEEGRIERPIHPEMRFATRLFNSQGESKGILIINYSADFLLQAFTQAAGDWQGELMLLNQEGYWLYNQEPGKSWGFLLEHQHRFSDQFPLLWSQMLHLQQDAIEENGNFWYFQTVIPEQEGLHAAIALQGDSGRFHYDDKDFWKVVALVDKTTLSASGEHARNKIGGVSLLLLLIALISVVLYQRLLLKAQEREWLRKTVRQRTQELEEQEYAQHLTLSRLRAIYQNSGLAILFTKLDGSVVEYNEQFPQMLGYDAESFNCQHINDFSSDTDVQTQTEYLRQIAEREITHFSIRKKLCRQDQSDIHVLFYFSVMMTDNDEPLAIGILQDISREVTLEENAQEKEQLLIQQSKMAAMGEMLGAIAHQWRQPLTAIGVLLLNLKDTYQHHQLTPEYMDKQVRQAYSHLNFLSETIDDFRNFFAPAKTPAPFCIIRATLSAIKMTQVQLNNCGIDLAIRLVDHEDIVLLEAPELLAPERQLQVMGFKNEFIQVVINLINNAKDAVVERQDTEAHQGRISISIIRDKNHQKALVIVEDNGSGISEQIIDRIFEPYFTTKPEGKGTGIGLYMSKIIIEKNMTGKLEAHGFPNGTALTISLPLPS
ncbi:sensor histidine kinase [Oceanospirillum sediminis]|uniref:histidine kinase n=1 Tax=Oceanospirillum sediminis TaxID=2760088 RepID=A0A839IT81_9GAMM|nr:ATP-binding protein [Oceanospirillum sediminis]MBB1487864.1 PAS domain S-box protein [Oceanospirillum sediminis]